MFSSDQLDTLMKEAIAGLNTAGDGVKNNKQTKGKTCNSGSGNNKDNKIFNLTPAQALVIAGLLGGVLNVYSVLVDTNQEVQIVLTGSFKKQENNDLENIMSQIGTMPFDEVVKAMIGRLR